MPRVDKRKTVSARKLVLGVCLVLLIATGILLARSPEPVHTPQAEETATGSLLLNGTPFDFESANTPELQTMGLSGRESLDDRESMLFVYDDTARRCFWMKDMKFNLDMLWLDQDRIVTHIEQNVTPESYPTSYCADGQYVLEVQAGTAGSVPVSIGDAVDF